MATRSFVDTLRDLRQGKLIDELDDHLQELVQSVQMTGGGGQLTLTIVVAPNKGTSEAVIVKDAVKLKKPEIKNSGTLMFPTPEGNLSRKHPRQDDLPNLSLAKSPTDIDRETGEVRAIG
jgi:hypothetical protein